jgi:hypothetical protein
VKYILACLLEKGIYDKECIINWCISGKFDLVQFGNDTFCNKDTILELCYCTLNNNGDIWIKLINKVYISEQMPPLFKTYKLYKKYPSLSIDNAFKRHKVSTIEMAIEYLEFIIGEEFSPDSEEAKRAYKRLAT